MKNFILRTNICAFVFLLFGCTPPPEIREAASELTILQNSGVCIPQSKVYKKGKDYIQKYDLPEGKIKLIYQKGSGNSVLITSEFTASQELDSLTLQYRFYNLTNDSIRYRYCLPFSLPYIRKEESNNIPSGFIDNGQTFNNTFSLITDNKTYSVSIMPFCYRMGREYNTDSSKDYSVSFYPDSTSITLRSRHLCHIGTGDVVTRRYLLSNTENGPYSIATGYHIGEYMNEVGYRSPDNLSKIYAKSMHYLLKNSYAFGKTQGDSCNYYGAIHSQTGEPFGNGNAVYAMYGNSFSVAALNQYLSIYPDSEEAAERLKGVEDFLLRSDVLTNEGGYWSMLDLQNGQGYVDQAYRKWLETHATAWITYFLLNAYEITKDAKYLNIVNKTLEWLVSHQREDGSFPKYFENTQPSKENLGDIAWVVLSFLKAHELGLNVHKDNLLQKALLSIEWMENNIVRDRLYCGSFEDVGGISDSYCPSNSARSFIAAYKATKNIHYLDVAKEILSVSLAWVTTDMTPKPHTYWNKDYIIQPAFAHVESVSCYYPCSYTLPMMYLACSEIALLVEDGVERNFWQSISSNLNTISDFMLSNETTKACFGMEWLPGPYLVFSEWGNMQLSWVIIELIKNYIAIQYPSFVLNEQLTFNHNGHSYRLFLPAWEGNGNLIEPLEGCEPIYFKDESGGIWVMLIGNNTYKEVSPLSDDYRQIKIIR